MIISSIYMGPPKEYPLPNWMTMMKYSHEYPPLGELLDASASLECNPHWHRFHRDPILCPEVTVWQSPRRLLSHLNRQLPWRRPGHLNHRRSQPSHSRKDDLKIRLNLDWWLLTSIWKKAVRYHEIQITFSTNAQYFLYTFVHSNAMFLFTYIIFRKEIYKRILSHSYHTLEKMLAAPYV